MSGLAEALASFYRGKRVLLTGHTGLKGSWLALWLRKLGANVVGVALPPVSPLSMFNAAGLGTDDRITSHFFDVRDLAQIKKIFADARPEIVFHLAAQAIVGTAYRDPVATFMTNVIGTANMLEAMRLQPGIAAGVMITSDKCYENVEQIWGYREHDRLGGADPYSASKAAAEIAISTFTRSYFAEAGTANIASARAGNVVGGGDWSEFRLIPDCIRSLRTGAPIILRNPQSTRPWQFALEPLAGYLLLGMRLAEEGKTFQGAWNFGPPVEEVHTVEESARTIVDTWGSGSIECVPASTFHESNLLALDCSKSRRYLGWRPVLSFQETMQWTAGWYKQQNASGDGAMRDHSLSQLDAFEQRLDEEVRA